MRCVIINNYKNLPSPFLVELSKCSNADMNRLDFCKDYIINPPNEMCPSLKALKEPSMFCQEGRKYILNFFVTVVVNDNK